MDIIVLQTRFAIIRKKMPADVKDALVSLFYAQAFLETIRPVSDAVRQGALDFFKPVVANNECGVLMECVGKPITDWDELYLADDEVAKKHYTYHKQGMADRGFKAEGECCPFLVAEGAVRRAKWRLFEIMEPFTGISGDQLLLVELREKYLSLLVGLLVTCASEQNIELNPLKV